MNLVSTVGLRVVYDERAMDPGAGTDFGEGMDLRAAEYCEEDMCPRAGAFSH